MNLTLYYNSSERKVIGKSLQNLGNVTGILKGDATITSPVFILASNNNYLSGTNYLYWQETGRYYYIDNIELMTGGRMAFYCSVDVLESFKTQIKAQTAIIDKQESISETNLYLNDGSFIDTEQTFNEIKNFQTGFNEVGEFILINAGA